MYGHQIVSSMIACQILATKESGNLNSDFNIGEVGFITCKYGKIFKSWWTAMNMTNFHYSQGVVNAVAPRSKGSSQKEPWHQQVLVLFHDLQNYPIKHDSTHPSGHPSDPCTIQQDQCSKSSSTAMNQFDQYLIQPHMPSCTAEAENPHSQAPGESRFI